MEKKKLILLVYWTRPICGFEAFENEENALYSLTSENVCIF